MEEINIFLNFYSNITVYHFNKKELFSSVVKKFKNDTKTTDVKCKFIYNGKSLDQNKTLEELNLMDKCNINVLEEDRITGGISMIFTDLSKNIHEEHYFSNTAPDYRIVSKGINVYGICHSKKCKAYKKEVIWPLKGKTSFNLIKEKDDLECPICGNLISPKTLGFYFCKYLIKGKKCEDDIIKPFELRDTASNKNSVRYFNPDENGSTIITDLTVEVTELL